MWRSVLKPAFLRFDSIRLISRRGIKSDWTTSHRLKSTSGPRVSLGGFFMKQEYLFSNEVKAFLKAFCLLRVGSIQFIASWIQWDLVSKERYSP